MDGITQKTSTQPDSAISGATQTPHKAPAQKSEPKPYVPKAAPEDRLVAHNREIFPSALPVDREKQDQPPRSLKDRDTGCSLSGSSEASYYRNPKPLDYYKPEP